MALKSNGSTFLDDNRNYSATANTALANDAYILIANNDTVSSDGYSISDTKAIADDGFAFNQFNAEEQSISFSAAPPNAYGSISGYTSGGNFPVENTIDKFPFATDANATDVGDLTVGRASAAGQSSDVSGYTSGGTTNFNTPGHQNTIDKFPFATDANATDVGDLTQVRYGVAGQTSSTSGYASGGGQQPNPQVTTIDKFPFAADANATDVGDLTAARGSGAGQSSAEFGYTSGGGIPGASNVIDKFPFASDGNATDVGDLTQARQGGAGQSSDVSGYTSGGAPPIGNVIDKFSFATDVNATDVGDLTRVVEGNAAGQSSTISGYTSGGESPINFNIIDKFPFAADADATDVGDLTRGARLVTGQQV
jgi:hypothetical protein